MPLLKADQYLFSPQKLKPQIPFNPSFALGNSPRSLEMNIIRVIKTNVSKMNQNKFT